MYHLSRTGVRHSASVTLLFGSTKRDVKGLRRWQAEPAYHRAEHPKNVWTNNGFVRMEVTGVMVA